MPRKSHKKQTRLAFAPAAAIADEDANTDDRFRTLAYGHPSLASVRPEKSETSKAATPKKKKRSSKSSKRDKSPASPQKESSPGAEMKVHKIPTDEKTNSREAPAVPQDLNDSSSDDEIIVPSSQRRNRRALPDGDSPIMSPPKTDSLKKKRKLRRPLNTTEHDAPSISDSVEIARPRGTLKRKAESSPIVLSDSDDSEEPVVSSPVKRRRWAQDPESPRTPRPGANQDELDIEEDVRDLQDSVVKKNRTRGRIAESARDKRLRHVETLRRRRAGLKEESEPEPAQDPSDDDNDSSREQIAELRDEDVDSDVESAIASNEDLDRYEDDFVLEDDSAMLGVPTEEIPLEFTRHAYKQLKEYFRDVVGWMVHNRLDPAFPRSDAMYEMAFMKLEDEVKGRAGSQLISSVWGDKFRRSLLARPHMEITAFPTDANHPCDACNRSGHPASTDMKLYGKPYSLKTLEPLIDDSDEDQPEQIGDSDAEDGQGPDRDRDGRVLPDENIRFFLGRHCKNKAQLAHTLTHWRFHLNEWVVDYLDRMGHMADAEVLRRNNLSQKRKTRNAIKVIDRMVAAGEIDKLWRDFHMNLKSAREQTVRGLYLDASCATI
ncbi:uncharacterized protein N7459_007167 [Penicillium hispanicum]|uniref:uncharacterized protein n=1 Tax=Penicillium hispanicum TaxID=1080232 RepID=UPI0025422338|nr:uncharacterized protein N7459_007167 [Penicillium hispanicum]KAJ5578203.1 hypothetical protein N7459_007167 [Penicillium hispanicum]